MRSEFLTVMHCLIFSLPRGAGYLQTTVHLTQETSSRGKISLVPGADYRNIGPGYGGQLAIGILYDASCRRPPFRFRSRLRCEMIAPSRANTLTETLSSVMNSSTKKMTASQSSKVRERARNVLQQKPDALAHILVNAATPKEWSAHILESMLTVRRIHHHW